MRIQELIEKLEDLATFLTLAASDAKKRSNEAALNGDVTHCTLGAGQEGAYKIAFSKVDNIIKEAKR